MLVDAGKYRTEDKLKIHTIQKLKATQKKQITQNTPKQNYSGSVAFYDTWPGNEVGLLLQWTRAHTGHDIVQTSYPFN